jgi:hypothetical protein
MNELRKYRGLDVYDNDIEEKEKYGEMKKQAKLSIKIPRII